MKLKHAVLAFLFVAGCSGGSTVTGGNAALGVTQFEIHETSTVLTIVGYDDKHASVVDLTLRKGYVELRDEGLAGEGKELTFNLGDGKPVSHTSVGTMPVRLPLITSMVKLNAFVTDAQIAPVLMKWGVSFVKLEASAEQQYGSPSCGHSINSACGATDCFSNGDDTYEEVCCGSNGTGTGAPALVARSCSTPFGTSSCGTNGPGGCAPCYNIPYSFACVLWTWPDLSLDYNGPNCLYDSDCQGVNICEICAGPYDANGYGTCSGEGYC